MGLLPRKNSFFILLHQAAVTRHIGGNDCGKLTLHGSLLVVSLTVLHSSLDRSRACDVMQLFQALLLESVVYTLLRSNRSPSIIVENHGCFAARLFGKLPFCSRPNSRHSMCRRIPARTLSSGKCPLSLLGPEVAGSAAMFSGGRREVRCSADSDLFKKAARHTFSRSA